MLAVIGTITTVDDYIIKFYVDNDMLSFLSENRNLTGVTFKLNDGDEDRMNYILYKLVCLMDKDKYPRINVEIESMEMEEDCV